MNQPPLSDIFKLPDLFGIGLEREIHFDTNTRYTLDYYGEYDLGTRLGLDPSIQRFLIFSVYGKLHMRKPDEWDMLYYGYESTGDQTHTFIGAPTEEQLMQLLVKYKFPPAIEYARKQKVAKLLE